MSISFSGLAPSAYIGTPYAIPFQLGGPHAICVPLSFNWASYGAGNNNQNLLIPINLSNAPGQVRQLLNAIRSVYIDNTGSAVPVYVQCVDTLWTVVCQPFSTGWYPLFTNAYSVNIAALGFTNQNVSAARITLCNIAPFPFTDTAYQAVLSEALASPTIGGGSGIASIVAFPSGQDYNNGNLSISGGGGTGAQAHGILDQWGRFTSVIIDDPGTGYTGLPIVAATGGQTLPNPFNPAGNYAQGARVLYNGTEWQWNGGLTIQCGAAPWNSGVFYGVNNQVNYVGGIYVSTINGNQGHVPSSLDGWVLVGSATPSTSYNWLNSGTAPGDATFTAVLSPQANAIVSPGYGVPALGDQVTSFFQSTSGTGKIKDNLFGTPYVTGFIYITHIDISLQNQASLSNFEFELTDGIYAALSCLTSVVPPASIVNIQKANIKLDATQDWYLTCTRIDAGSADMQYNFVWTYSQQ